MLAGLIAGVCLAGFFAIWLTSANRELTSRYEAAQSLLEQYRMHARLARSAQNTDEKSAAAMAETSRLLFREAAKSYNDALRKPINRLPAALLGYRPAETRVKEEKKA